MRIENIRILLQRYTKEIGFKVSNVTFLLVGVAQILTVLIFNKNISIDIVLVKDLSRLGINQIETSLCIQVFFRKIRFVLLLLIKTLTPPKVKMII